jgi:Kef-type K+ transport system membrane component KefB
LSDIAVAAVLAGTVLLASTISVEIGISVALIELAAGFVVGNALHLSVPAWLGFVGSFAGVVLTFLARAEVDVAQLRREWRASVSIGLASFGAPLAVCGLLAYFGLGWNHRQAEVAGIALSTTSLAVVYAVLVETGLNRTVIGKRIMAATFVTDLATVTALTVLFIKPSVWIVPFAVVSVLLVVALPRLARPFFGRYGDRVIEPELSGAISASLRCCSSEDGTEARGRLPARTSPLLTACAVHHAADEHRAHVRNDQLALRAERAHHRPEAVLIARRSGRPVGDRADGDRPASVPAADRGAP